MTIQSKIFAGYVLVMTIIGFLSMYIDKRKAIKHQWRIPEKTLFIIALLGGSIGSNLGMTICRHKTKHWYFVIGMPVILILQIIIVIGVGFKLL
ncbi:MAG: DUF1294 domain-containing protein [Lachnospiraceae bacterium]|nr:DUF1294 domain-containing protein [Lachnospiraceae bacterium]